MRHAKEPGPWVTELRRRRPLNVAVVALANKMARTIWAMLAHERTYQKGFVGQPASGADGCINHFEQGVAAVKVAQGR